MTMAANDPRKPIFDAIRAAKGSLAQHEVIVIDDALDSIGVDRAADPGTERLGSLSEEFESGSRGPGAVSTGVGDPGGVSYGVWQLSGNAGTAAAFIDAEGAPWRSQFGGATPGSPAFSQAWRSVAAREPDRFRQAQYAFIKRTHYDPAVKAVRAATGLDLDTQHLAVRDVTWSVSVQHGRAAKILTDAVNEVETARDDATYPHDLINSIYDVRTAYVLAIGGKVMEGIAHERYPAERAKALEMLA